MVNSGGQIELVQITMKWIEPWRILDVEPEILPFHIFDFGAYSLGSGSGSASALPLASLGLLLDDP